MLSQPTDLLVKLNDICLIYDDRTILHHIDLQIEKGDFIVLTGPNGGGKTSILKVLLKLIKPTSGTVQYYSNGTESRQLHIGYLPQKNTIDSQFPITVQEVVASGLYRGRYMHRMSHDEMSRLQDVLEQMGIADLKERHIGALSGGQLQRALLGRAIISQPQLLVLDEPMSYIDEAYVERIYQILAQLSTQTTIIMVTHRPHKVANLASRTILVDKGRFE